jgi:hypothetical protein
MNAEPRNVIVTENACHTCGADTIHVHHQSFPEMHIGGHSADEAAQRLAQRLVSALDVVADQAHREPVRQAIADITAFLDKTCGSHPGRDL